MKTAQAFFILLILASHVYGQETAADYMSKIGNEYHEIQNDTWAYMKAAAHGRNARKIDKRRLELAETIKKANSTIRRFNAYQKDPSLRDATVKYLSLSEIVIKEDYGKIVDLEKIAEESYDAMEAYLRAKKEAGEKLSAAHQELDSAQSTFAAKHGINLVSKLDKQGEKIKKASEVMDYYNKVYLVFFKSYKQEGYVLQDLSNNDIGAFEQNKNTLNTFSTDGLLELDNIGSYKGDPMMKLMGKKLLNFYQKEASEHFDTYSKTVLLKEKLEKMSKYLESKKPSKRTQEDIDKYNDTLREYNEQVNIYNKINDALNKQRTELLKEWNDDSEKFMAKHVPK